MQAGPSVNSRISWLILISISSTKPFPISTIPGPVLTSWQMRYLGLTNESGFTVPVHVNEYGMEQCTTVEDDRLEQLLEEADQWMSQLSQQED